MIWTHHIRPELLQLGVFQIRWYGLMYVIGFFASYLLMRRFSREGTLKLSYLEIDSLLFYVFIGLFLGARIFYVFIYNFDLYRHHLLEIFEIWKGGLSFHGGLVGVVVAGILFSYRYKISFWQLGDTLVMCAPLGLGFGRIGNFINGELFGRFTHGPWGVIFPEGGPLPRHPSQLYESLFEGFILFTLMWFFRKRVKIEGQLSALFLIFYGVFRFFIEYFREPDLQLGFVLFQFSMGQILCFLMMIAGSILYWKRARV